MKTYFYDFPSVTVCLIVSKGNCARGLSIKSSEDAPDPSVGQYFAKRHALMALGRSRQLGTIKNPQAIKVLIQSGCPFVHRGELNPVLTWQEVRIMRLKSPFQFSNQAFIVGIDLAKPDYVAIEKRIAEAFKVPAQGKSEMMRLMYGGIHTGRMTSSNLPRDFLDCFKALIKR